LWFWAVRFVGFVWDPLGSFGLCFWLAFGCFYVYSRCTQGRLTLLNKTFITYQKNVEKFQKKKKKKMGKTKQHKGD
jgi:hypothetical protein